MFPLKFFPLILAVAAAKYQPLAHHANADMTAHAVTKTVYHTSVLRLSGKASYTTTLHGGPVMYISQSDALNIAEQKRSLTARHSPHIASPSPAATKSAELPALHISFQADDGHMMLYLPSVAAAAFCKDVARQSSKRSVATVVELEVKIGKENVKIPVPGDNAGVFCQGLGTGGEEAGSISSATLPGAGKTSEVAQSTQIQASDGTAVSAKPPKSGASSPAKATQAVPEDANPTTSKIAGDLTSEAASDIVDPTTPSVPAAKTNAPAINTLPQAPSQASPAAEEPEDPYSPPTSAISPKVPEASAKQATTPPAAPESAEVLDPIPTPSPSQITQITPLTTLLVSPVDDGAVAHADTIAPTITPEPKAQVQEIGHKTVHVTNYVTAYRRTMGAAVRPRAEENTATRRVELRWWWRRGMPKRGHGDDDVRVTSRKGGNGSSVKAPKPTHPPEEAAEESGKGESEGDVAAPSTKKALKPTHTPVPSQEATPDHVDGVQLPEDSLNLDHEVAATSSTKKLPKPTSKPTLSEAAAPDHDGESPSEKEERPELKGTTRPAPSIIAKPAPSKHTSPPPKASDSLDKNVPEDVEPTTLPRTKSSKPKPTPPPAEDEHLPSQLKPPKHKPTTASPENTEAAATQYDDPETISYSFPSATEAAKPHSPLPPPPPAPSRSALLSWDPNCEPTAPLRATPSQANPAPNLGCWVSITSGDKEGKAEKTNTSNEPTESSAAWGKIRDPRLRWTVVVMWGLLVLQVVLGWWEFGKGAWGWERWLPVVGRVGWWDGKIAAAG
ncbi:hypothetical protein HBI65_070330 [Parastagonospora nodorum]|nr:hypothetical protein HBH43_138190 [Parastagonospora nodorum]KAH4823449.1 hypothetical protein HBH61_001670 [Parastagonospora nodorum]KAH4996102.1 hypothetical protein HBI76_001030 [Parastagonospora nodorum]KAH5302796.1 hypothetical protein HBI50_197050 [Parastagonospora nodorum]KAH6099240.1 hypothetical protein HBI65_070330 [Parastagonospora nodorum]